MRTQDAAFHLFLYRTHGIHTKALAYTPSFMLLYGFIPTSTAKRNKKNLLAKFIRPVLESIIGRKKSSAVMVYRGKNKKKNGFFLLVEHLNLPPRWGRRRCLPLGSGLIFAIGIHTLTLLFLPSVCCFAYWFFLRVWVRSRRARRRSIIFIPVGTRESSTSAYRPTGF